MFGKETRLFIWNEFFFDNNRIYFQSERRKGFIFCFFMSQFILRLQVASGVDIWGHDSVFNENKNKQIINRYNRRTIFSNNSNLFVRFYRSNFENKRIQNTCFLVKSAQKSAWYHPWWWWDLLYLHNNNILKICQVHLIETIKSQSSICERK